jgi:hypothetical protein
MIRDLVLNAVTSLDHTLKYLAKDTAVAEARSANSQ